MTKIEETRYVIGAEVHAGAVECGGLPPLLRYCEAVTGAFLTDVVAWLTEECTECGTSLRTASEARFRRDHVLLGRFVIVGCEGYWLVNPNAVGIPSEAWNDWRPHFGIE